MLRNKPDVVKYFAVLDMINDTKQYYAENNILDYAFSSITGTSDADCNIYIYLKTYRLNNGVKYLTESYRPVINPMCYFGLYSEFMNIETKKIEVVKFIERDKFEKNNIVIFPPNNLEKTDYYKEADCLRYWYLDQILYGPQEEITRKLKNPAFTKSFYE